MSRQKIEGPGAMAVAYPLGHAPGELERLERQGELMRPVTLRTLEAAGIGPGMRVLDLGTGTGDVARLAAGLVGPTGSVVGVDHSADALATAARIAAARGLTTVEFVQGDLATVAPEELAGPFDAVVGRLILMHLADPVAVLRRAAGLVRPGGVLAFVDPIGLAGVQSSPEASLMRRTNELIHRGFGLAGSDALFGLRLPAMLTAAGLVEPRLITEGIVVSPNETERLAWPVETLRPLLPFLERAGVPPAEVGIDTLAERLAAEAVRTGNIAIPVIGVGCWARTPA